MTPPEKAGSVETFNVNAEAQRRVRKTQRRTDEWSGNSTLAEHKDYIKWDPWEDFLAGQMKGP